jgi:hypothetical protein
MTRGPFDLERGELPAELPIFPLTAALLLPRGRLPLNIFEPRYLNMTLDALKAPSRLIGMVQPVDPRSPTERPEVYPTGCAGRISTFSETDDGRLLITLAGACRFRIVAELTPINGYRRVTADYQTFRADLEPERHVTIDREQVLACVKAYFKLQDIDANWEAIEQMSDEHLVCSLAMSCPFEPGEKQALLEAPTLAERSDALVTILQMALHGTPGDDLGARQ